MNYNNPQPKIKRIRLKGAKYTRFREEVFTRAKGKCEHVLFFDRNGNPHKCGKYAPLRVNGIFDPLFCGHVSHLKHGSQKEDTLESVIWECPICHNARHTKGIRT